jgi:hypothetical protein
VKGAFAAILVGLLLLVPRASEAQQPQAPMPAGHPPVGGAAAPGTQPQQEDAVLPAAEIPPGTIVVRLVNEKGDPVANHDVKLGIVFQKISEGEQRKEQSGKTDANGMAKFSGLASSSDFSYRVLTRSGPAEYASDPIHLKPEMGVVALLHSVRAASFTSKRATTSSSSRCCFACSTWARSPGSPTAS